MKHTRSKPNGIAMTVDEQTGSGEKTQNTKPEYDVLVIGAGAVGVGVAVALRHAGIENFGVIDRSTVGASFASSAETRFITPSFPTNSVGMLDLNSIALGTSPAYSLEVEHLTGQEYAAHLRAVAIHYNLPICENTEVERVVKIDGGYRIYADRGSLTAKT